MGFSRDGQWLIYAQVSQGKLDLIEMTYFHLWKRAVLEMIIHV